MVPPTQPRVLIVDLNNFSHYPTIPVGQLVAVLRRDGFAVTVFSPLAVGISGFAREGRARPWGRVDSMARYVTATSDSRVVRSARARLAKLVRPDNSSDQARLLNAFADHLAMSPEIVLVSAYTMFLDTVAVMAGLCGARGIPLLVGGSYFNDRGIAAAWLQLPGLSGVVAGEAETFVSSLVRAAISGHSLAAFPGVWTRETGVTVPAPPLRPLDDLPFADYSDFPWDRYSRRIVPIITGRGCGWGACTFCSDVTSVAGRSWRGRSADHVLDEIAWQRDRHAARLFVFHDLKLNSDVPLWRALIRRLPSVVPDAAWTCAVHVGPEADHGLTPADLKGARAAGLTRVTTGLESGSQRILNAMAKGTRLAATSRFLRDASAAGLSVRTTIVTGYPGETPDDIRCTARFLDEHSGCIERVMVNRFSVMPGARFHQRAQRRPAAYPAVELGPLDIRNAVVEHSNTALRSIDHKRAVWSLLGAAHRINRRPLSPAARVFEGVM